MLVSQKENISNYQPLFIVIENIVIVIAIRDPYNILYGHEHGTLNIYSFSTIIF